MCGAGTRKPATMRVLAFTLLVLFSATEVFSSGNYFFSTPKEISRGQNFTISVDILNGSRVDVRAILQESVYNGKTHKYDITDLKNVSSTFFKGTKGIMNIPIEDDFKCPNCQLVIQGRGSQSFDRKQYLAVKSKVISIFIQTDKAIYKPGQRVRYRAFAVYPNLQVYKGSFSVEIRDSKFHKLVVEENLRSRSGVVEGFLNLSDQPPFGDWLIEVAAEDLTDKEIQSFTVAEYELPRFEVTIQVPTFALLADSSLSGTIKAKYTYGKPVKGLVELYVGPDSDGSCGKMPKSVNVALEIDGEVAFSVPKSSIQRVMGLYSNTKVRITALVKESATGVQLKGTKVVEYHQNMFTISYMSNSPNVFKPGLLYTAFVQVKTPDGLPPPEDTKNKIIVYSYAEYSVTVANQSKYGIEPFTGTYPLPTMTLSVPANGIVPIYMYIPKNATKITMKAYFNDLSTLKSVSKTFSLSNNYMQLTLKNNNLKSGSKASFQIKATELLSTVFYEIIARGSVKQSGTLRVGGRSIYDFMLHLSPSMAPVANLLTYYIRNDSEIVADSLAFNIDGLFENEVAVEFSKTKAEPHTNIQLKVSADPKSEVFILAVDQSVLLLKSGNDIDIKKVEKGISNQDPLDSEFALSHSAANVGEVFFKSGLRYITDAMMVEPVRSNRRIGFPAMMMARGSASFPDIAFDSMSVPTTSTAKPVERIRKEFPEAWLWTSIVTLDDGTSYINTTVPDTITTWVASAFATNLRTGLGVAAAKANVTAFRSFFVSLTYPSTLKRNEQAVIQATVFNYLTSPVEVIVSIKDSEGFQHIEISSDGTEIVLERSKTLRFQVRPDSEGVAYFPIVAKKIGVFDLEVKAQSPLAADAVRRQISIQPEGAPVSVNRPIYIEQDRRSANFRKVYSFTFPQSTIAGSEKISVGVSGDLIGPSLDNMHSLVSIPTGCGEQNLVKIAPTLYFAKYLQATRQLSDRKKKDLAATLATGYQRQLGYVRSDGSFSPFGERDQSGSTWLTAQVARVLSEARQFIYVDPQVLINSVDWLVDRQRSDGAFVEVGKVIDPNTQNSEPALTGFCLLSLLQNGDLISETKCKEFKKNCGRTEKWMNATRKAISYLERNYNKVLGDSYSLSVVSYALGTAGSSQFQRFFRKLIIKAVAKGPLLYLEGNSSRSTTPAPVYYRIWDPITPKTRPLDILTTSYAIMSFLNRGQVRRALPMVKWLVTKKNPRGGFSSTQDTTVALQALSAFATRSIHLSTKLRLTFESDNNENLGFTLKRDNLLNFQRKEFQNLMSNDNDHKFEVTASAIGNGFALAEIDYNFHTSEVSPSLTFDVSTVLLDDGLNNFNLMICTKYLKEGKTGMVVQEIEIPSGFEPDLTTIGNIAYMKRYERKGNVAAIYFDEIVKSSTCYSVLMTRKAKVAKSEKSFVRTFSYYVPEDESTVFYQPVKLRDSKICDVCPRCC